MDQLTSDAKRNNWRVLGEQGLVTDPADTDRTHDVAAFVERFLRDLAYVTTEGRTAVVDGYDPEGEDTKGILDYYEDPPDGLAHRPLRMGYDGILGDVWLYRLFTSDRIREVATGTDWTVATVRYPTDDLSQLVPEKD